MIVETEAVVSFGEGSVLIRWGHGDTLGCYYCPISYIGYTGVLIF